MSNRFVVLTGGPGAGKTTLVAHLRALGFAGTVEAGRATIADQVALGGPALPWTDPILFGELMLSWELRSHHEAHDRPGPVFFDRGAPDLVGYHRQLGGPVPTHVHRAARQVRYHPTVFIAPPWPEIFTGDAERRQTLAEAEATYRAMVDAYPDYGYELVELPRVDVAARAAFVLDRLGPSFA